MLSPTRGRICSGRRLQVVGLHAEQDQIDRADGGGIARRRYHLGYFAVTIPQRQSSLLHRRQVRATRNEADFLTCPIQKMPVTSPECPWSHHCNPQFVQPAVR